MAEFVIYLALLCSDLSTVSPFSEAICLVRLGRDIASQMGNKDLKVGRVSIPKMFSTTPSAYMKV